MGTKFAMEQKAKRCWNISALKSTRSWLMQKYVMSCTGYKGKNQIFTLTWKNSSGCTKQ
jgi:hypothetical protein